jgi:hypothetical protein
MFLYSLFLHSKGSHDIKEVKMKKGYNWKLLVIIILLLLLIGWIIYLNYKKDISIPIKECVQDTDCAPKCGCHPDSCVSIEKKGNCEKMFCSQDCSGPLDCNAGYCSCINNKCQVVNNAK